MPSMICTTAADYVFVRGYDDGRAESRRLFSMDEIDVPFPHRGEIDAVQYRNGFRTGNMIAYNEGLEQRG